MTLLQNPPTALVPRQHARPTSGCSCTPPWPLLYTIGNDQWQQVAPATQNHPAQSHLHGPAWCVGCGATYTGPWQPITP